MPEGAEKENPTRRVKIAISVDLVANVTVEMVASAKMDAVKSLVNAGADPRAVRVELQIPSGAIVESVASGLAAISEGRCSTDADHEDAVVATECVPDVEKLEDKR